MLEMKLRYLRCAPVGTFIDIVLALERKQHEQKLSQDLRRTLR